MPGGLFLYFRATASAIYFCSTILLHWRDIVKRKQKKCDLNKKKRMAPQNHPLESEIHPAARIHRFSFTMGFGVVY